MNSQLRSIRRCLAAGAGAATVVALVAVVTAVIVTSTRAPAAAQETAASEGAAANNSAPAASPAPKNTQQRLEQLPDIEKRRLAGLKARFDRLPHKEKERLRALQQQIDEHPDNQRLKEVMLAYTDWIHSLSAKQITTLQETPLSERIARIRQLKAQQDEQRFKQLAEIKLSSEDISALMKFVANFVEKNEDAILAKLPSEWRKRMESLDARRRRQYLVMGMMPRDGRGFRVEFSAQDIASLRSKLSSQEAIKAMTKVKTPKAQAMLIRGWLHAAAMSRSRLNVSQEEIQRFYREDLKPEHREAVEQLPADQMAKRLREYYFMYNFRRDGSRWPHRGRGGDGGRGDGRGGDGRSGDGGRGDSRGGSGEKRGEGGRGGDKRPGPPPFGPRPGGPRPSGPRPDGPRPDGAPENRDRGDAPRPQRPADDGSPRAEPDTKASSTKASADEAASRFPGRPGLPLLGRRGFGPQRGEEPPENTAPVATPDAPEAK